MTASSHICPLCSSPASLLTKHLSAAPIRAYWKSLGYDTDVHHPDMPANFSVYTCVACGLGTFEPQMLGGPALYEALGRHDFYYEPARWDHRTAAAFLNRHPPRRLLEFGCGDGKFLDVVRAFCGEISGVDFNAAAVAAAKAKGHAAFVEWPEQTQGPFDAIVAFQTLEHVPEPGKIISQFVERLAPGGHLIIAVPNEDGPLGDLGANMLNLPPHHATLWPRSALDHVAARHGLTLVEYATEPMNRALYVAMVEDEMARLRLAQRWYDRLIFRLARPLVLLAGLLPGFAPRLTTLVGGNHLAVYRK